MVVPAALEGPVMQRGPAKVVEVVVARIVALVGLAVLVVYLVVVVEVVEEVRRWAVLAELVPVVKFEFTPSHREAPCLRSLL